MSMSIRVISTVTSRTAPFALLAMWALAPPVVATGDSPSAQSPSAQSPPAQSPPAESLSAQDVAANSAGSVLAAPVLADPALADPALTSPALADPVLVSPATDPLVNPDEPPAELLEALARSDALREQIARYEREGDTWQPEITEILLSLGRVLQDAGDHEGALQALERAVHLARVNHGLFGAQQLPAVALQIDSYLALEDWEQADSLQQYMFYVESRLHPQPGPEQIPSLERFVHWHFDAFEQRQGRYPTARLMDAYQLLSVILAIVDQQPDSDAYPVENYLEQMAYVAWMMHLTGVQTRYEAQLTNVRWVEEGWVERATDNQYRYGRNPHLQGQRALERILALRETAAAEVDADHPQYWELRQRHTEALLNLADWQLMFNRRQGAVRDYRAAWDALDDAPPSVQARVFERVVVLPRYRDVLRDVLRADQSAVSQEQVAVFAPADDPVWERPEVAAYPHMFIRFGINRFGRTDRVSVVEVSEEMDDRESRRMLGLLRNNLLRPVIREGEPAHVQELEYRFAYMIESHLRQGQ